MSNKEYIYHTNCNKDLNSLAPAPTTGSKNIKSTILQYYDLCEKLKKTDTSVIEALSVKQLNSQKITNCFDQFQKTNDPNTRRQLSEQLNKMTDEQKNYDSIYRERMRTELQELYQNWPDIFDMVIEGVDRSTLDHVLTCFEKFQKGQISSNDAVYQGIDYITDKYQLPHDFFNKSAVDQFNKLI